MTLAGARQGTAGSSRTNTVLGRPEPAHPHAPTRPRTHAHELARALFLLMHAYARMRVNTQSRARLWHEGHGRTRAELRQAPPCPAFSAHHVRLVTILHFTAGLSHRSTHPLINPRPSLRGLLPPLPPKRCMTGRVQKSMRVAEGASFLARERTLSPLVLAVPHTASANAHGHARADARARPGIRSQKGVVRRADGRAPGAAHVRVPS